MVRVPVRIVVHVTSNAFIHYPKKRGPVLGKRKKSQQAFLMMQEQLAAQQRELEFLRTKCATLETRKGVMEITTSTIWQRSIHFGIASNIATWIQAYNTIVYPVHGVSIQQWNSQYVMEIFQTRSNWTRDPEVTEILAMLSIGASYIECRNEANHFIQMCKQIFSNLGTYKHPSIANALILSGDYGYISGVIEEFYNWSTRGEAMLQELCQDPKYMADTLCLDRLKTILRRADIFNPKILTHRKEASVKLKRLSDEVMHILDSPWPLPLHEACQISWCVLAKIWTSISHQIPSHDGTFGKPVGYRLQHISEDQFALNLYELSKVKSFVENFADGVHPLVSCGWDSALNFVRAVIFFAGGFTAEAHKLAQKVFHAMTTGHLSHPVAKSIGHACFLYDVCSIAIYAGDGPFFVEVFCYLYKQYPDFHTTLKSLAQLAQEENLQYDKSSIVNTIFDISNPYAFEVQPYNDLNDTDLTIPNISEETLSLSPLTPDNELWSTLVNL